MKDLADTAGIRTTYGSPLFADHVPDADAPHVALLKAAGAVIIGKTNTPEFGAGSQTFNAVFGVTRNPWDTRMTPGDATLLPEPARPPGVTTAGLTGAHGRSPPTGLTARPTRGSSE